MFNEPDYYDYEREPSEIENVFSSMVDAEVTKRTSKFFEKMKQLEDQHEKDVQRVLELVNERNELKKAYKQSEEFSVFKSRVNDKNIYTIVSLMGFESIDIDFSGMDSEKIPMWFKLIAKYYPDRNKVFSLLDLFEIQYPSWARTFKLPFDYGEVELDIIFNSLSRMGMTNGQYFSGNMGFYYRYVNMYHGDLKTLFEKQSGVCIPWNLFLKNTKLVEEKYFTNILKAIKDNCSNASNFFRIQEYLGLSQEQVLDMIKLIPLNNIWEDHKRFIDNNKDIIQLEPTFVERFKDKINDNSYSPFYYMNFPFEIQREYIVNKSGSYESRFEKVQKLKVTKKEKLKLLQDIASQML